MTTSSTDLKVWVKETEHNRSAFRVTISGDAIVDDLKKAITNEAKLDCAASKLKIKASEDGDALDEELNVAEISSETEVGKRKAKPFFFTQPPGKLVSLNPLPFHPNLTEFFLPLHGPLLMDNVACPRRRSLSSR